MPSETETQIMNARINSMESIMIRGIEASEQVATSVNQLLIEFKERDIRHEYEKEASEKLAEKVSCLNTEITEYIRTQEPIISRARKVQERWDSVYKSMTTTTGKLIIGVLILGAMVMLGLDPRSFIKM